MTASPEDGQEKRPHLGYRLVPAASFHFLTPCFDVLASLTGFGRGFKARVVELASLADGMRVLDLGCGSGLLALLIKQRYPRCEVIGVDADPRILEIARRRAAKAGLGGVEFLCAPAERTGLPSASVDAALSTLTFHHLPLRAKEQAAREAARVLRPGRSLTVVDLRPLFGVRRSLTPDERAAPRLGLRTNAPQVVGGLLTEAGFAVQRLRAPRPWTFALRGMRTATPPTPP